MEEDKTNKKSSRNHKFRNLSSQSKTYNQSDSLKYQKHVFMQGESSMKFSREETMSHDLLPTDRDLELLKLKEITPNSWKNIPIVVKNAFNTILEHLVRIFYELI